MRNDTIYLKIQDEKGKVQEIERLLWILWSEEKRKKYLVLDVRVEEGREYKI